MHYKKEILSPNFTKHLIHFTPVQDGCLEHQHLVIHNFTKANIDEEPHDHPFAFTTHILKGSYVERVYYIDKNIGWTYSDYTRKAGTLHRVEANTIHKIIGLPDGECWTVVLPEQHENKSGFYQFNPDGTVLHRFWDEAEFKPIHLLSSITRIK